MRILHFIPEITENKDVRKEYFKQLMQMKNAVDMRIITSDNASDISDAERIPRLFPLFNKRVNKIIKEFHPDVVHIHGCIGQYEYKMFTIAEKHRIPILISPLGDLTSMTLTERSTVKKLTSAASRARRMILNADAIHVTGEMEMETVKRMVTMPVKSSHKDIVNKIFMVKNSVLTNSITTEMMCNSIINIYSKIIFLRAYDVMLPETRACEKILLRLGVCPQYFTFNSDEKELTDNIDKEELHKIFVNSEKENVRKYIDSACQKLHINYFVETDICRKQAGLDDNDAVSATDKDIIFKNTDKTKSKYKNILRDFENYSEEVQLFCLIAETNVLLQKGTLTYRHLAEICKTLTDENFEEDVACKIFKEADLDDFAARLMYIIKDYTGLPDGFMPIRPINDKKTIEIEKNLTIKSK